MSEHRHVGGNKNLISLCLADRNGGHQMWLLFKHFARLLAGILEPDDDDARRQICAAKLNE